jgi:hypothetical protein
MCSISMYLVFAANLPYLDPSILIFLYKSMYYLDTNVWGINEGLVSPLKTT